VGHGVCYMSTLIKVVGRSSIYCLKVAWCMGTFSLTLILGGGGGGGQEGGEGGGGARRGGRGGGRREECSL
jgi:hypothetical protein